MKKDSTQKIFMTVLILIVACLLLILVFSFGKGVMGIWGSSPKAAAITTSISNHEVDGFQIRNTDFKTAEQPPDWVLEAEKYLNVPY